MRYLYIACLILGLFYITDTGVMNNDLCFSEKACSETSLCRKEYEEDGKSCIKFYYCTKEGVLINHMIYCVE